MVQYQGTPDEGEMQIIRVVNALKRSIRHQPAGLDVDQAGLMSDDELLRIKGIGRASVRLIRRLHRLSLAEKEENAQVSAHSLEHKRVCALQKDIADELARAMLMDNPNVDYLYTLRQADAVLKDLAKYLAPDPDDRGPS